MIASRILLIPVIAAVGYEILKFGARHRANPLVKVLLYPGLLVQMITTKQPTDDMIEVAIVSMEQALEADGEAVPAGSTPFERDPMVLGRCRRRHRHRPAGRARARRDADTDRPAAGVMSDLDAKLAEVARQYDDLQAELARPETSADPSEHPPARPGAGPPRAGRRGVSAASRRHARELAGARELRDAGDGDDEMRAMARDGDRAARGRRGAAARRAQGAPAARATRTTTAT